MSSAGLVLSVDDRVAIAPGTAITIALFMISITTIETVSAASRSERPTGTGAREERPHRQALAEGEREDDREGDRRSG